MHIISASRRTDIPAFYSEWLLRRLRAGYCHWLNPIAGQVYRTSLRAEDCLALVLWTRNPAPLLPHLPALLADGYRCYFHITLTGYPRALEPRAPSIEQAMASFRRLAELLGPELVIWRYDPTLISNLTPPDAHLASFAALAQSLHGLTRQCITSFVSGYAKTTRNLRHVACEHRLDWRDPDVMEKRALLAQLRDIAAGQGIALSVCCNPELTCDGTPQAHCVDPALIRRLRPELSVALRSAPTRPGCGCYAAVDIGAYHICGFGCAYCYATENPTAALARVREHDPDDTVLWRPPALRGVDLAAREHGHATGQGKLSL